MVYGHHSGGSLLLGYPSMHDGYHVPRAFDFHRAGTFADKYGGRVVPHPIHNGYFAVERVPTESEMSTVKYGATREEAQRQVQFGIQLHGSVSAYISALVYEAKEQIAEGDDETAQQTLNMVLLALAEPR